MLPQGKNTKLPIFSGILYSMWTTVFGKSWYPHLCVHMPVQHTNHHQLTIKQQTLEDGQGVGVGMRVEVVLCVFGGWGSLGSLNAQKSKSRREGGGGRWMY